MQIKTTYYQTNKTVIANKTEYKRHHYHDYSVITSDKDMDEECAYHMIIEIYKQTRQGKNPGHDDRFIIFMINNYAAERTGQIMAKAGCTLREINEAYEYFDNHRQ
eukprot:3741191-Amphidinium_carterae.1